MDQNQNSSVNQENNTPSTPNSGVESTPAAQFAAASESTPAPAPAPADIPVPPYVDNRVPTGYPQNPGAPQHGSGIPGSGAYNPQFAPPPQPIIETEPPMRVRDWLIIFLLTSIPCVNIVLLFVWAFTDSPGKKSRSNYCKATLIWTLIQVALVTIIYVLMFVAMIMLAANAPVQ